MKDGQSCCMRFCSQDDVMVSYVVNKSHSLLKGMYRSAKGNGRCVLLMCASPVML